MPLADRIRHVLRSFPLPSARQLLRLPTVLDARERMRAIAGIVALLTGGALLFYSWYERTTVEAPAIGGTYVEGLVGEPRFVNPIFAMANDVDADLARLIYSGLFRTDRTGAVVPDLAERYELSDDGKSLTVQLKDGLRWHDGALLTASDVVFTMNLIEDPNAGSPLRGSFRGVTVERVDDRTVRFTIERPLAIFLSALTVGILPEHVWVDIPPSHLPLAEMNLRPVGSGPFAFVGLTKDRRGSIRSYTVERYPGYHDIPARIARITFRLYGSTSELLTAFNGREVDGIGTLVPMGAAAITRHDITRYPVHLPQTTAMFLNEKRAPALRDTAVRRALSIAIDRRTLLTDALNGAGTLVGGPLIPGFSPIADPPAPDPFDAAGAATALDRAKWERVDTAAIIQAKIRSALLALEAAKAKAGKKKKELAATDEERKQIGDRIRAEVTETQPYYRLRNGTVLEVTITTPDAPEFVAIAERVRDAWRAIGVRATVDAVSIERIRGDAIPNRAYDALLFSQILGPDPDPFPFWHSSQVRHPGLNLSFFSNKAIDKALEDARGTLDRSVRGQKYQEFQRLLAEERPAIFLMTPSLSYVVSNAVRGITLEQPTQPTDRFATITEWYTEVQRVRRKN
ncbi:peptide ABC transporter substrate-binding protein [Candidatus Uhrbacteria bacterium]|nr:peptide ABC transporter substrate-binding protein [Candidatus Uhrbacteria bacterium]